LEDIVEVEEEVQVEDSAVPFGKLNNFLNVHRYFAKLDECEANLEIHLFATVPGKGEIMTWNFSCGLN
jgi:hypothetical protein